MRVPYILLLATGIISAGCKKAGKKNTPAQNSELVAGYIKQGDSIYAQKANYSNFLKSMELYDSAWHIADESNDTALLAKAVFAKGRAYDAINNNPQKTIDYYTEAAHLYSLLPQQGQKALYIKHLVAHSYDKVQDSANCVKIVKELYAEIAAQPDSIKKQLRFTVEMALISTVVKNYVLADEILQNLTKREWIENDETSYDYLNHYYLAKAKIDVCRYHNYSTLYLDSVENVFKKSHNLSDSAYYSDQLWELYKKAGNAAKEAYYLQLDKETYNKFNNPETVWEVRDKLSKMEVAAVEAKRKAEEEKAETRKVSIYVLVLLLSAISLLALFLIKRNREIRRRKREVISMNRQLHQKNLQNELLNKEIHHRVKNNLQMIMSLVYMQESNTDSREVKENMQNIRLRIESIAALHQHLMEQTDVLDLRKYIQYLVSNATSLVADNKKVITHLDVAPLKVPQKKSFPLGLIINEWVTNSVKYALPLNSILEITVSIYNDGKHIKVIYKDNGRQQTAASEKNRWAWKLLKYLPHSLTAV